MSKKKKNFLFFFIVFMLLASSGSTVLLNIFTGLADQPDDWVIDGDKVYVDNSDCYASANPHTLGGSGYVVFEFESKQYTGDADFVWGFDVPTAKPRKDSVQIWKNITHPKYVYDRGDVWSSIKVWNVTSFTNVGIENYSDYDVFWGNQNNTHFYNVTYNDGVDNEVFAFSSFSNLDDDYIINGYITGWVKDWNNQTYFDWEDIILDFDKINYNHGGMNTWYLLKNQPIVSGHLYKIRAWIDIPFGGFDGSSGKYWYAFKPSGETIQQAIQNDHFYALDPWWDTDFSYMNTITFDSSQIPSTQTYIPTLINITDTDLQDASFGDGRDIAFTLTDNSTQLNHHIVNFSKATGHLEAWVNITSLPHDSDLQINIFYGNSGAGNQANMDDTYHSCYALVMHMTNDTDSSGNDTTITNNGADSGATGLVGDCFDFVNANADSMTVSDFDDYGKSNEVSFFCWIQPDADSLGNDRRAIYDDFQYDSNERSIMFRIDQNGNDEIDIFLSDDGTDTDNVKITPDPVLNIWSWYGFTWDASNEFDLYFNGYDSSDNIGSETGIFDSSQDKYIGEFELEGADSLGHFDGKIDELFISSKRFTKDYMITMYNMMNNASVGGFIKSFSSQRSAPAGGSNNAPVFSNPSPYNNTIAHNLSFVWNVTINDPDGDTFNWTIESYGGQTNSANGESNGSKTLNIQVPLVNTTYKVWVNVTDGTDWTKEFFYFKSINFASGIGTSHSPFNITHIEHLWNMRFNNSAYYSLLNNLDFESDSSYLWGSHMTENITGNGWNPLFQDNTGLSHEPGLPFNGSFDGNNYTINHLYINRSSPTGISGNYIGFISRVESCREIKNIGIINANVTGSQNVGILVGWISEKGYINNSYVTGKVRGNKTDSTIVGGFTGGTGGNEIYINRSYSRANVTGRGYNTGGFIGFHYNYAEINNSYATGDVRSNSGHNNDAGGFAGTSSGGIFKNCYSTGNVTGHDPQGFLGDDWGFGTITTNCFWDTESSGVATSEGGTGKTTSEMKLFDTFNSSNWDIDSGHTDLNDGYPYLAWQNDTVGYAWLIPAKAPEIPFGTINTTTNIDQTTAKLNGYVKQDGNDTGGCSIRFQYCSNNTNYAVGGSVTAWQNNKNDNTEVNQAIGSLDYGTLYYARMQMKNDVGWYNTSNISFMTQPFNWGTRAVVGYYNNFNGTLRVVDDYGGNGGAYFNHANYTIVRYRTDTYPTDENDGIEIFNGTRGNVNGDNQNLFLITTSVVPFDTKIYVSVWNVVNWSNPNHFQVSDKTDGFVRTPIEHKNRVLTDNISKIQNNSAVFHLNLSEDGSIPNWVRFEYGTDSTYGSNTANVIGVTEGIYSEQVTGLTPGQLYFVRAFANNTNSSCRGDDPYIKWVRADFDLMYLPEYVFSYNSTLSNSPNCSNIFGGMAGLVNIWKYESNAWKNWLIGDDDTSFGNIKHSFDYFENGNTEQNLSINLDEQIFITRPTNTTSPFNISGADYINVSWSRSGDENTSVVIRNSTSYPTSLTDGTLVYNNTNPWYNDTGISGVYYYSVWTYAEWIYNGTKYHSFSSNYTQIRGDASNRVLVFSNENPANNTPDRPITFTPVQITIEDPEGKTFNWTIEVAPSGDSNNADGDTNGTKNCALTTPLNFGTTYTWYVNATDGVAWTNASYNFITRNQYIPSPPTGFSATTVNRTQINLAWTNNGTNNTLIEWNNAPSWTMGDGTELYNGTGTSYSHTGLTQGTTYYYQAWSYNTTDNVFSTTNSTTDARTDFNQPQTFTGENPTNNSVDQALALTWNITINDPEGDTFNWVIECSSGDSNNANGDTNGSKTLNLVGLSYNTLYKIWVNSTDGFNTTNASYRFTTRAKAQPLLPTNYDVINVDEDSLSLTWTKGVNSTHTYIERNTTTTGTSWTRGQGTNIYNSTGSSYTDTGLEPHTNYTYRFWSYNSTDNIFNNSNVSKYNWTSPGNPTNVVVEVNGTTLEFDWDNGTGCTYNVIIQKTGSYPSSPTDGTEVYNDTHSNWAKPSFNTSDRFTIFTYNSTTGFYSSGVDAEWGFLEIWVYKEDEAHIQIGNYTLFITNNDATETYQAINQNNPTEINVNDIPNGEDITIQISKAGYKTRSIIRDLDANTQYNISFYLPPSEEGSPDSEKDEDWYVPPPGVLITDVFSVDDYTTDEVETLECSPDSLETIYVYNSSIYGGWIEVPDSKYSLDGKTLTVNSTVLDKNSSLIRVTYYCDEGEEYSSHYIITVVDDAGQNIEDAYFIIQRYINTTDDYENVFSSYTDSSGQVDVDLIHDTVYYIKISKTNYENTTSFWSPPEIIQWDDSQKTFILYPETTDYVEPSEFSIIDFYGNTSFGNMYIYFYDNSSLSTDIEIVIYEINTSSNTSSVYLNYTISSMSWNTNFAVNTSNNYLITLNLSYNGTSYNSSFYLNPTYSGEPGKTSKQEFEDKLESVFGENIITWAGTFGCLMLMLVLFSFGQQNAGVSMILAGFMMLGFNIAFNLILLSATISIIIIIFGILVQWQISKRSMKR